jgi:hypothetical protein
MPIAAPACAAKISWVFCYKRPKWHSVSLDRPSMFNAIPMDVPSWADYRRSPTGASHSISVARVYPVLSAMANSGKCRVRHWRSYVGMKTSLEMQYENHQ